MPPPFKKRSEGKNISKRRGVASPQSTSKKVDVFLRALCEGFSITGACERANISRRWIYDQKAADKAFAQAVTEAIEAGTETLEDVATKRAKARSDVLLMFLLNGRNPDKFRRQSRVEVANDPKQPFTLDLNVNLDGLSDAELTAKYREALGKPG